ncbi:MAG: zinc-dependent alcohol dehydrogenase family protein [Snodgrassella sp.]|uniref:Alcohol dehydrogenase n=1 Tax=Snodgrassella alvi TaxID=1196083 RepID=A0A2N9XSM7_9NEIS|nr:MULTISPECIES: zinc-dependent alcohol dehydrogenase family protein [Snodgrassella]MCO6506570.1 zinc-dependent alcohol dehydrogenase family protein [Snodgrassella sp.]MCO6507700.1 zinc-dependent alcohol dehydrogenase family protein [Snodgrassella sp.]MCO6526554.1 zinc-dependent alcohol dehydrogenase family protein [Snodgrassella sp.]PIT51770.1 alcohol dehydrogenase [Snodgrassella communis]SCB96907.1 alcohol dehydrogenase [Snodgrassella sp. R-53583]
MKAMVYYGAGDIRFEERAKPAIIEPTDAVIRLTKTTICGTDLGIWKGKNPEIEQTAIQKAGKFNGRILGHEGIGIVEETGSGVKNFKKGDKVIISCVSRCGTCENCQKQLYAHCQNGGGWIMGYMIDGTQAEYVRTPFADNSLYRLPADLNEDVAVLLSDALPTAHEIGVQYGDVKPGDTVAIVGAGPVGMSCLLTAQLYSPSQIIMIDMDDNRLHMARELGATQIINSAKEDAVARVLALTNGRGVDCAMEAVGLSATWDICQRVVKEGGHLANVGVHGQSVNFELEKLWIKNLTITTGLVNANTTGMLLKTCCSGKLPMEKLATHHFHFNELEKAYDVFKHAADQKAMKVIIDY